MNALQSNIASLSGESLQWLRSAVSESSTAGASAPSAQKLAWWSFPLFSLTVFLLSRPCHPPSILLASSRTVLACPSSPSRDFQQINHDSASTVDTSDRLTVIPTLSSRQQTLDEQTAPPSLPSVALMTSHATLLVESPPPPV